jgi:putative membrane protein
MSETPDGFSQQLATAVAEVEGGSAVELVVLLAPRSGTYPEAALLGGLVGLYAVFALVMFQNAELGDYLIFTAPLIGLLTGAMLVGFVSPLRRLLTFRAAIDRNVELVARATFQKAGLAATRDATALLVYLSLEERRVQVIADRGVLRALGEDGIAGIRARYVEALRTGDLEAAVLTATRALAPSLATALPPRPDDINELPDVIDVAF